jgi:hypothetical protein
VLPSVDVFIADEFFVWATILRTLLVLRLGAQLADVPCIALGRPTCGCVDVPSVCIVDVRWGTQLATCLALRWGTQLADMPCVVLGQPTLVRLY